MLEVAVERRSLGQGSSQVLFPETKTIVEKTLGTFYEDYSGALPATPTSRNFLALYHYNLVEILKIKVGCSRSFSISDWATHNF
jgi:hypothetical protein